MTYRKAGAFNVAGRLYITARRCLLLRRTLFPVAAPAASDRCAFFLAQAGEPSRPGADNGPK